MSRMSDRGLWVSVFNTALAAAMAFNGPVHMDGKPVSAREWAKHIADKALQEAPKDES